MNPPVKPKPPETITIEATKPNPLEQRLALLKDKIDFYIEESAEMRAELSELRSKIERAKTDIEKQQLMTEAEARLADKSLETKVETQAKDPLLKEKLEAGFAVLQHLQANPTAKLDQLEFVYFITDPALLAEVKKNPALWAEIKSYAQTGSDVYAVVRSPECKIDDPESWSVISKAAGRDLDQVGVGKAMDWMKKNPVPAAIIIGGGLLALYAFFNRESKSDTSETSWWKWGLGGAAAILGLGAAYQYLDQATKEKITEALETGKQEAGNLIKKTQEKAGEIAESAMPNTMARIENLRENLGNMNGSMAERAIIKLAGQAEQEGIPLVLEQDGSKLWLYAEIGKDIIALPFSIGHDAASGVSASLQKLGVSEGSSNIVGIGLGAALVYHIGGIKTAISAIRHVGHAAEAIKLIWHGGKLIATKVAWPVAKAALSGAWKIIETTGIPKATKEVSKIAYQAMRRELAKRAVGEGSKKFFAAATKKLGLEAAGKFIAKRVAVAAGSNVIPVAGQVASVGLAVWTVAELGFMAVDGYSAYNLQSEIEVREQLAEKSIRFDPATESKLTGASADEQTKILAGLPSATLFIEREGKPGVEEYHFENGQVVKIEIIES